MRRSSSTRARALALLAAVPIIVGGALVASPAYAAEATVTSLSVTVNPDSLNSGGQFTSDLQFCIADGAVEGDTVTIQLPNQMFQDQLNTSVFTLRTPDGTGVVGSGQITPASPRALLTITLSDYVEIEQNVCGRAEFDANLNGNGLTGTTQTLTYTPGNGPAATDTIFVVAPSDGVGEPTKHGGFRIGNDQGRNDTIAAIRWTVMTPQGPLDSYTLTDDADAGQRFNCSAEYPVSVMLGQRSPSDTYVLLPSPTPVDWDPANYTLECTPERLTLTTNSPIPADRSLRIRFHTDLVEPTPNESTTYRNQAVASWVREGVATAPWTTRAAVSSNGVSGSGSGDRIEVVKYSGDPVTGDHDTAPGLLAPVGSPVAVSVTVTNRSQPLTNVIVTDQTLAGPAMSDLTCDFSPLGGPSAGTTWAGPFATNASFQCTGTVPALAAGELHSDTIIAQGTGNATVYGRDPFHTTGTVAPSVSVGDYVWVDTNRDGVQDDPSVEPGIPGVTLTILGPTGEPVTVGADGQPYTSTTTTDETGAYLFDNLPALADGQTYTVVVTPPTGYVPTVSNNGGTGADDSSTGSAASQIDLTTDGAHDPTLDFGFILPSVSVGDYVWVDTNRDGVQDDPSVEPGIPGVTLTILGPTGEPVTVGADGQPYTSTTTTDETGAYLFDNLPALADGETYTVVVTPPTGYVSTVSNNGGTGADDSSTGSAASQIDLTTDGAHDPTLDFGFILPSVSVGDYVWVDTNRDGVQDDPSVEPGIAGVTLTILGPTGEPVTVGADGQPYTSTTTTDETGAYLFDNLPALADGQTYTVVVTPPTGYVPTVSNNGGTGADDSSTGSAASQIDLTTDGAHDPTLDFGFILPSYAVGDVVWIDGDKDGVQDDGESPLAGVTVILYDAEGVEIDRAVTDDAGRYLFDELPAGEYSVRFVLTDAQAALYEFTSRNTGEVGTDSDADGEGWTVAFVLDGTNANVTRTYDRTLRATEGVDPTWDAGVILRVVTTPTPTDTPTPTPTPTDTPTPTPTDTPTPTPTDTPTGSPEPTPTDTPTGSPEPTSHPTKPPSSPAPTASTPPLAVTGADSTLALGGAVMLLVLGSLAVVIGRRRAMRA